MGRLGRLFEHRAEYRRELERHCVRKSPKTNNQIMMGLALDDFRTLSLYSSILNSAMCSKILFSVSPQSAEVTLSLY